jgi:hypothetical protein
MTTIDHPLLQSAEFQRQLATLLMPDYFVRAQRIEPDEATATLTAVGHVLRTLMDRADLAWAGARIALLLDEKPWLASCAVTIDSSSEYNDGGGTMLVRSISVSQLETVESVEVPDEFRDGDDVDVAALEDDVTRDLDQAACDFASAFMEPDQDSSLTVRVDRSLVAELLAGVEPISGSRIAERLWPDYKHLLTPEPPAARP